MVPRASAPYSSGKAGSESPVCWAVVIPSKVAMTLSAGAAIQQSNTVEIHMVYRETLPKRSDAWFSRQAEHALDCIAIAEGRMTAEEANAKWYAILKQEREDQLRQMDLCV